MRKVALVGILVVAAAFGLAPAAAAKSYHLTQADEAFHIQRDGSVLATETLTFDFSGQFHGAYRLIPVASGETVDDVQISESGNPYSPGADARVGSSGNPDTYGVMTTPEGWTQVAWHFDAHDTTRTFIISYRMRRYVRAYSDIGNLYLQVWGDQWPVRLDSLHVVVTFPGAATAAEQKALVRVWGHPGSVAGTVAIAGPDSVTLAAQGIPAQQFVEIDTTFPRRLLAPTGSFVAKAGPGLAKVTAAEQQDFAASPYGPSPTPVSGGGGGGGGILSAILLFVFLPFILLGRLFGFGRGSSSGGGVGGLGGSFGGFGGGGGGGGGGGAW